MANFALLFLNPLHPSSSWTELEKKKKKNKITLQCRILRIKQIVYWLDGWLTEWLTWMTTAWLTGLYVCSSFHSFATIQFHVTSMSICAFLSFDWKIIFFLLDRWLDGWLVGSKRVVSNAVAVRISFCLFFHRLLVLNFLNSQLPEEEMQIIIIARKKISTHQMPTSLQCVRRTLANTLMHPTFA